MKEGSAKDWMEAIGANIKDEPDEDTYTYVEEHSLNREEVIATAEINLDFFAMITMPTVYQFGFPPVLQAAWDLLKSYAYKQHEFPQLALGIPRGHGKTTLIKLYILFCILFTKKKFILIIGSTATLAENILADVTDMLNEPNIVATFGDWKLGLEVDRQDMKKFGYRSRNIILYATGAEGSIRGLNLKNERPDVMIFDDVQTKECAESQLESGKLERWMIGTAMKAKSPAGCVFIFAGNMYPGPNSILKKLKTNPSWIKFISGAILSDGQALWPDLRSVESLVEELDNDIAMGHPEIFFSEVLNDTEAGINSKIDFSKFAVWPWSEHEMPQTKFIIIDPAGNKSRSDFTSIGYFEGYDNTPGLKNVIEEILSPGNTIRKAILMALKTRTRLIAIESTGYQASLLYWFNHVCNEIGITGLTCVEVYSGSNSKNARIATALQGLAAKEIVLHESVKSRVLHQISNWNPLKRDNTDGLLDLLTYAPVVLKNYGVAALVDTNELVMEAGQATVTADNTPF